VVIATYKLSEKLASFEFFYWLVMVQAQGATKVVFDTTNPKLKNITIEDVLRRYTSILQPGPALAGMQHFMGQAKTDVKAVARDLIPWYKAGNKFKRLMTVKQPIECKYTVTIRDNRGGAPGRNSNREVWTRFANEIDAVLIDDYYDKPIHLHDRVALYAGAKMNFGVCNGPMHMLSLTPYPMAMFVNSESARGSSIKTGLQENEKLPWMLPNQHVIWKKDKNIDELLQTFKEIK